MDILLISGLLLAFLTPGFAADGHPMKTIKAFLPDAEGSKIVSIVKADEWDASGITVLTEAVAIKETGPRPFWSPPPSRSPIPFRRDLQP